MSDRIVDGLAYPVVITSRAAPVAVEALRDCSGLAVVYDARVARRAAELSVAARHAGVKVLGSLALRGGERIKSVSSTSALWRWLLAHRVERASVLVAVGGGTLTDLAGFAAATYMRGIAWVAVPTTLLGMVDASIGGKTAIDLPEGKNVAGVFWPPRAVVADVGALTTLPRREMENGMAEIIKSAVIGDPSLLELADAAFARASNSGDWGEVVAAAARVKIGIVAADPLETGRRAALNLGHTLGHAIEHASRGRLSHGRAVAIGLRGEGLLAIALRLFSPAAHARVLTALRLAGLPLHDRALDLAAAMRALLADKKRLGARLRFSLPVAIGDVRTGIEAEPALVRRVLAQCARAPRAEELEV